MECGHPRELLDAYLDAELDAAGSLDVERHLRECTACSAIVTRHRALREALRAPELYRPAPAGLRARLESKRAAPRSRFAAWPALLGAIAAGLLLTLSVGYGLGRWSGNGDSRVEQEVAAAHVRSLQAEHLVDVASSDRHTVKPWFAGKIDFAPIVADFAGQGFALVGGRLDYLDGRPAAALVFKRREHLVNVFLQPRRDGASSAPRALERQGFHLLHGVVGGFDCWLISDTNAADLRELLGLLGST
jgi:anti-sigma factor RsiW